MILDTVLEEQSFDKEQMIDMFIEGYLAACEVIDNNIKFENIEEMTEVLEETALQSIREYYEKGGATNLGREVKRRAKSLGFDMSSPSKKDMGIPRKARMHNIGKAMAKDNDKKTREEIDKYPGGVKALRNDIKNADKEKMKKGIDMATQIVKNRFGNKKY